MGNSESILLSEDPYSYNKTLDLSRDVSYAAFIKHINGEVSSNCLSELPYELCDNVTLYEKVNLSFNQLTSLPEEIPLRIPHLTQLILSYNKIVSLPNTFYLLFHMRQLHLDHNEFQTFPQSVVNLMTLELLDLSHNRLSELPKSIGNMGALRKLNVGHNKLKELPDTLAKCPLVSLLVTGNNLLKPPQDVCDEGSAATIKALHHLSQCSPTVFLKETLEFVRSRGSQVLISSFNPSSVQVQYNQLQMFPDRVKTPLIPPIGATRLDAADLKDRIVGLLYGAAIGDAIGVATEGLSKDECLFYYDPSNLCYDDIIRDKHRTRWKKGDWTDAFDQTAHMLDSLLKWAGVVDELEFARRIHDWCQIGGSTELGDKRAVLTSETIAKVTSDPDFLSDPHKVSLHLVSTALTSCGLEPESIDSYADDSCLPRAIVLGIPFFHNVSEVMDNSVRICRTTHSDSRCVAASAVLSGIISLLLQGKHDDPLVFSLIAETLPTAEEYIKKSRHFMAFKEIVSLNLTSDLMAKDHYCLKAFAIALQSLHWKKDFRSVLLKVVMQGGDCKVSACLTGALHGCLCGFSGLPKPWVQDLLPKRRDWLNAKINHLLDLMALP